MHLKHACLPISPPRLHGLFAESGRDEGRAIYRAGRSMSIGLSKILRQYTGVSGMIYGHVKKKK
ncbi:MAG: hypothetical protein EP297_14815 [Gammaproteobacteria bacterium]|nr:MAG: hypothetical protein EP297_14815 [Gammaproteobacteria bacterium]